jgi:predicted helicase
MLSQHIITKPVFEAFEGYSFVKKTMSFSIAMQNMTAILDETNWKKMQKHSKFYRICKCAAGIDNAEGKQEYYRALR